LTITSERPAGDAGRRAWRREGRWRVWDPAGLDTEGAVAPGSRDVVMPDLQDAVTVAILARELALVPAGQESR